MASLSIKISFVICLAFVLAAAGCDRTFSGYSKISIMLPKGANLSQEEIRTALEQELPFDASGPIVEITVYAYSTGKERLVYEQDGIISEKNEEGYIKLLLAFRRGGVIQKALFLQMENQGVEGLIRSLKREIISDFSGRSPR